MSMMLLAHAVDEAFARMAKVYGRDFTSRYEDDPEAAKAQWAREISGIPEVLDAVAFALKNLPERAPNAIQFRNLCRQAPSRHQVAMPLDGGGPVRGPTDDEMAGLLALRDRIASGGSLGRRPGHQWAFDLIERFERGDRSMSGYAMRCAREVAAMGSHVPHETEFPEELPQKAPMATGKPEAWADLYDDNERPFSC